MKTSRGIYLNLEETTYSYRVKDFKFYFSSRFYRDKYIKLVGDYVNQERLKLQQKFNTEIISYDFLYFLLYSKIEKRGFLVTGKGKIFHKIPDIELNIVIN